MKPASKSETEQAAQNNRKRLTQNSTSYTPVLPDARKKEPQISSEKPEQPPQESASILMGLELQEAQVKETLEFIRQLKDKEKRPLAYQKLNSLRDIDKNLAVLLWHSPGTIAIILQEITAIYPNLNTTTLKPTDCDRFSNVLGLFQCLALDPRTRSQFLKSELTSQPPHVRVPLHQPAHQTPDRRAA